MWMVEGPHFCFMAQAPDVFCFENLKKRWIKLEHLKRDVEKELTTHTCLGYMYTHTDSGNWYCYYQFHFLGGRGLLLLLSLVQVKIP